MHSPDLAQQNIAELAKLFPNCVTEAKAEDGSVKQTIDFDLLRQELSNNIVEGPQERYHLNWPGKREALLTTNAPIVKTLRPCVDESVNFNETRNLFVEGDNLEALKLLQETYLNRVKLIYIDPPYNTGSDFIYPDDFSTSISNYLERSSQIDSAGKRLIANSESNGRFHSDWLSMMFARLKLARNLLRDDGVIFISVDDGEVSNLRKICDEVFGETNFCAQIIWKKRSTPPNDKQMGAQHDYILVYGKSLSPKSINLRARSAEQVARYQNPDNHPKGPWASGDLMANVKGGRYVESLYFPIVNPRTGKEHFPSSNGNWRFNAEKIKQLIENDEIYFGADDEGRPKLKRFLADVKDGIAWTTLWDFPPLNTEGSKEMAELFDSPTVFENPKPVGLIKEVLLAGASNDEIVVDFFGGSATTAVAAMELNAEDGGSRRFILVQLPEPCDQKSEAFKLGFENIAQFSRERIRRAGVQIKDKNVLTSSTLDIGFRVLKVDSSNMKDVYYAPDTVQQRDLLEQIDNIKSDRTPQDLLFQVLLDWGVDLALPIVTETFAEKTVFFVDGNTLAACFDSDIDESLVKQIASKKPLRAVFRDNGYGSDATKINVEQIFKVVSPGTEVRSI